MSGSGALSREDVQFNKELAFMRGNDMAASSFRILLPEKDDPCHPDNFISSGKENSCVYRTPAGVSVRID